jgi:predicted nucleotidyltransferase
MREDSQALQIKLGSIVRALSTISQIKGVLCFGSYAMRTFDKYSDIDLYVFCSPNIVPSSVRKETLEKVENIYNLDVNHTEFIWDNEWNPEGDRLFINKIQFDITYNTVEWIKTVVRKVKETGATSIPELKFRPYTMLGLLDNSLTVYDPESIIQALKSKLYPYPSKLKEALLIQTLPIARDALADLENYVQRNIGNTAFHYNYQRFIDSLGTVLFAINERYDPATKRVEEVYSELKILPPDFLKRYKMILEKPLTLDGRQTVVTELRAIMDEVESLVVKSK